MNKHSEFSSLSPVSVADVARWQLLRFATVKTTQDVVKDALKTSSRPVAVLANSQTGGRGRWQRAWVSPVGSIALSFSVSLGNVQEAVLFQMVTGYILSLFLQEQGLSAAQFKWPNDVWVKERKLAGILGEWDESSGMAIVGVGVNLNHFVADLPNALTEIATSFRTETGREVDLHDFVMGFLEKMDVALKQWQQNGWASFLPDLNRRVLWRDQKVALSDEPPFVTVHGIFRGVAEDGAALIEQNQNLKKFYAGDLRLAKDDL